MPIGIVGCVWENSTWRICPEDIDTGVHKVRRHAKRKEIGFSGQLKLGNLCSKFCKGVECLIFRNQRQNRLDTECFPLVIVSC